MEYSAQIQPQRSQIGPCRQAVLAFDCAPTLITECQSHELTSFPFQIPTYLFLLCRACAAYCVQTVRQTTSLIEILKEAGLLLIVVLSRSMQTFPASSSQIPPIPFITVPILCLTLAGWKDVPHCSCRPR